jgi:predicted branched-subunit amino acid permease
MTSTQLQPGAAVERRATPMADGVRAMAPMLLAYAPFGLLVGAAVAESDRPMAAWLSTWTIYGGAAHLAVLDVLRQDAGIAGAALVGLLVNARMVAYSVSLAPHWRDAGAGSRLAAALMLTDATWGLTTSHASPTSHVRRRFYFGAGLTLWFGWPLLVSLGVLAGGWLERIPVTTLLPSLTLGALAVGQLRNRPALAAGATALAVALATTTLDSGVALALAAVAGTAVAALVHRRTP